MRFDLSILALATGALALALPAAGLIDGLSSFDNVHISSLVIRSPTNPAIGPADRETCYLGWNRKGLGEAQRRQQVARPQGKVE